MKVDNKTDNIQFNAQRDSVRIASRDYFAIGSVWIADMLHVPYGVGHHFIPGARSDGRLVRPARKRYPLFLVSPHSYAALDSRMRA